MFIAVGFLYDAIGEKWKTLTEEQQRRLELFAASELHMKLTDTEGIVTYDDYLNIIRNSYDYATKTLVIISEEVNQ